MGIDVCDMSEADKRSYLVMRLNDMAKKIAFQEAKNISFMEKGALDVPEVDDECGSPMQRIRLMIEWSQEVVEA